MRRVLCSHAAKLRMMQSAIRMQSCIQSQYQPLLPHLQSAACSVPDSDTVRCSTCGSNIRKAELSL